MSVNVTPQRIKLNVSIFLILPPLLLPLLPPLPSSSPFFSFFLGATTSFFEGFGLLHP
jgi:hypothetical protein